jgi:cytoskeletal protein CcmA (bactofilin family)
MWKRDEKIPQPSTSITPTKEIAPQTVTSPAAPPSQAAAKDVVNIGRSVVIKGELSGSENLTIEGQVNGKIELRDHVLTIGPNAKIKAEVMAKAVIVLGEVIGNVTASEKVEIRERGAVDGDIASPKVAIAEGTHFRGSIDMQPESRRAAQPTGPRPAPIAAVGGNAAMKA